MKRILLRALLIGIVLAPLTEFAGAALSMRGATEYSPSIGQDEMRRMDKLPFARVQALLASRAVRLTPMQALRIEVRAPFFWKRLAKSSILLFAAIFGGCILMGVLQERGRGGDSPHSADAAIGNG
jgi:hypothetical protein